MPRQFNIARSIIQRDSGATWRITAVAVPDALRANVADAGAHTRRLSMPSPFSIAPIGVLAIVVPIVAASALAPLPAQNTDSYHH